MKKKVVILGGGVSGLSTAYFLGKRFGNNVSISLVEKEKDHLGGWIQSDVVTSNDGYRFLFDRGARSLRIGEQIVRFHHILRKWKHSHETYRRIRN
jgi:protoporphyrinogen oxidase